MRYGDLLKDYINKYGKNYVISAENLGPMYYITDKVGNKFVDVGIAEQSMIGIASGIALRKKIPVVHAMAAFLTMRAYEFIRTDVCIGALPVKLVGTSAGILSEWNGVTHQAVEDIALAMSIPELNIFCPSDNEELVDGMKFILLDDKPWYIRYNDCANEIKHSQFRIGKAEYFGGDFENVVVTYGYMLGVVTKTVEYLKNMYGIEIVVVNLKTIRPLDKELILSVAKKSKNLICVEDHLTYGGIYTIISDLISRNGYKANMHSIGLNNYFTPGSITDILNGEGLSGELMGEKIKNLIENNL